MSSRYWLNPFAQLAEHKPYAFSRLWRATLWRRVKDTFNVLFGEVNLGPNEGWASNLEYIAPELETVGLVDYLTLFLFQIIGQFYNWCIDNHKKSGFANVMMYPTALLVFVGNIARLALCLALTVVLSPVTYLFHKAFEFFGGESAKEKALSLKGEDKSTSGHPHITTLRDFMDLHDLSFDMVKTKLTVSYPTTTTVARALTSAYDSVTGTRRRDIAKRGNTVKPTSQTLTLTYTHPKKSGGFFSKENITGMALLTYMMPLLAFWTVPQVTKSAGQALIEETVGTDQDIFEITVNEKDTAQREALSAFFQLNLADVLAELQTKGHEGESLLDQVIKP